MYERNDRRQGGALHAAARGPGLEELRLRPGGLTPPDKVGKLQAQTAALVVLEPIFEADLQPEQYAYRPGRSALEAVRRVQRLLIEGHTEVVEAESALAGAVGILARVAGDLGESQFLRSYCIEALMDIGPPTRAAIPVLERMLGDKAEDDDLRHFAWSALKSVGAPSRDHQCGDTVAEHVRSLYRAE